MKLLKPAMLFVCLAGAAISQTPATVDDLVKQVLAAVEAKNAAMLGSFAISEAEYRAYIWPKVSASNPRANPQKYFAMYRQGSDAGLSELLKRYGGQKLELVKVEPGATISQSKGYRVLSGPAVTVRTADGAQQTIRPIGAVLEHAGTVKVTTYSVTSRPAAAH